ncbi:MAG: ferredoxin [Deltaproteobacteria bacterium]|nr:ferredoxin [Deltaproteobacteria bacterium]MBW2016679.1 ferredoxin [Deltaproteobacteria bacterium]MBW2129166.1 ferredoxin [Deltaproteobacteria bacterium]MBW2304183.1 ferredoxin [Deltaproteobacteria bacterium]
MRVFVDKDICVGCEKCVKLCPEVFQMGGEVAVTVTEDVPPKYQKACKEAAEHCPVEAITIKK